MSDRVVLVVMCVVSVVGIDDVCVAGAVGGTAVVSVGISIVVVVGIDVIIAE